MSFVEERARILAEPQLDGRALCRALSDATDVWLRELGNEAIGDRDGISLVAVGGYGRRELAPGSDLDVVLVYREHQDVTAIADAIWYPIWDAGLKLGHAVRTPEAALALASEDLDAATSLLSIRHLAGDAELTGELAGRHRAAWAADADRWLSELVESVRLRHERCGETAFLLEPDLKEGRGGLRDVHALLWGRTAGAPLTDDDIDFLTDAESTLLDVRVGLHRHTGRRGDVLLLDDQDAVAELLDVHDADVLMGRVAEAARAIAFVADDVWYGVRQQQGQAVVDPPENLAAGLSVADGELVVTGDPATDPLLVLHAAVAAARLDIPIERSSLRRLSDRQSIFPDPWPEGALRLFVELLSLGDAGRRVIERLDLFGVWTCILPEWAPNRNRPQRNVYHRFTVDRHLLEAAAQASRLAHRVRRPDLLVLAALFHDIGKGYPGDHSIAGVELVERIGPRIGLSGDDTQRIGRLVRHHLLLPDVATRRDLGDHDVIANVATLLGSTEVLELLAALTEADSLATGPTAWNSWKADLVRLLTERVNAHIGGGSGAWSRRSFVDERVEELMRGGRFQVDVTDDMITVVAPDDVGVFSRVAGGLALRGLDVLQADAYSSAAGMAASQFRVEVPRHGIDEAAVKRSIDDAIHGRLAIDARLAERAQTYARRPRSASDVPTVIEFPPKGHDDVTIIEVHTADRIGVLYRVTRFFAHMRLDLRSAKIQTIGPEAVDTFYVSRAGGAEIDRRLRDEIVKGLRHALSELR